MRPSEYSWVVSGTAATRYANNVSGAGPWTMTNQTSTDGLARLVNVRNDSTNNHSGKTVTLIGTDFNGVPQTETLAGPGASATVTSTKYFKTLVTATISATIGTDTFDFGHAINAITSVIPVDSRSPYPANIFVNFTTGTYTYNVLQTFEDLSKYKDGVIPFSIFTPITGLSALTAPTYGNSSVGATAIIVQQTGQTANPLITTYVNQPLDTA